MSEIPEPGAQTLDTWGPKFGKTRSQPRFISSSRFLNLILKGSLKWSLNFYFEQKSLGCDSFFNKTFYTHLFSQIFHLRVWSCGIWFLNIPWELVVSQAPPALILVHEMLGRSRNLRFIFKKFLFVLGPPPAYLKGYSWLCIPESLLAVLKRPFEMPGIELGSAMCKALLPALLLLQPKESIF